MKCESQLTGFHIFVNLDQNSIGYKLNRIKFSLLVFILLTTLCLAGQVVEDHIVFNKLAISEQIFWPIHTIFQDHQGMMWFTGKNYLVSYDGNRIDTISLMNDEGDVFITDMSESQDNDLVISTTKGLYIIDPASVEATSHEPVLKGSMNVMVPQNEDHLWLGTNQGLLYYSLSGGLIKKLTMENGLPSDVVHGLIRGTDSTLWISTWDGMAVLPAGMANPVPIEHDKDCILYGQMAEDPEGHIWAGGESEITVFDNHQKSIRTIPSAINSRTLPPTFIPWQILLCDSRGLIWYAVPDKVNIYDPEQRIQRTCNLDFNFRIEQPTAVFEDKDGSIWLATTLGNIYRYDMDLFSYLSLPISSCPFTLTSIHDIAPLHSDYLAATTSEGLFLITEEFNSYRLILRKDMTALYIDPENRIWVTTDDELIGLEMDGESMVAHEISRHKLPEFSVSGLIIEDSDCWISTFDMGVYRLNMETGEYSSYMYHPGLLSSFPSNHITTMEWYDEKLWLGTVEGIIIIINPLTNEIERFNTGLGRNSSVQGMINYMSQVDDELWIATNAGIHRITGRNISSPDLYDRMGVKQILSDTGGFLWINHQNGIDVFDTENDRIYHVVGQSDSKAFSYLFLGPDQNIHLLTDTDIRRYSHILPEWKGSSTVISQSKINGEPFPLHSGSALDHDDNDLEIVLSVLSYRNPELNRYASFLQGMDTTWQETSSPVFSYQNLKPGNYIFHYRGANFTGQWGQEMEILFTILPSPWFTKWAIAGYSMVVILIAVIFMTLRRRNLTLARDLQEKSIELGELRKQFQGELLNRLTREKIEGRPMQSEDIQLLRKVVDFIDAHLADDNFSVENIAQGLAMSRTKLFRHMKLLTGVSPTEFIINYRLKLAAEMLRKRAGNISEISLSVGYKNPAHFSDSFRKFHGCTPSEFVKNPGCNEN